MNLETLRLHCLAKNGTEETLPFDEDTLVFKVAGKMFALISISKPFSVNLKCDPERALELREEFEEVIPGFHMNKKHWNTVSLTGRLTDKFLIEQIDHSYDMVVRGLKKSEREKLI